jgi:excisionase family DNA binding protein
MELLTTSQAAKILDLSPDSIRRFEREGILSAIRVGKGQRLFRQAEVESLRLERTKVHREPIQAT